MNNKKYEETNWLIKILEVYWIIIKGFIEFLIELILLLGVIYLLIRILIILPDILYIIFAFCLGIGLLIICIYLLFFYKTPSNKNSMNKITYEKIMPDIRARADKHYNLYIDDLPELTGIGKFIDNMFTFIVMTPLNIVKWIFKSIYILLSIAYYSALPLLILYFIWCMIYLN